jgi:hypothetical protein
MTKKTKTILVIIFAPVILFILYISLLFFSLYRGFGVPREYVGNSNEGLQSLPCELASSVELGRPLNGGEIAEFTLNDSDFYIYAHNFNHGGFNDWPPRSSTTIYIGNSETPPNYDSQRAIVTNVVKESSIEENRYSEAIKLSSGRYWLWSSNACDIVLYSCDPNGVSDPKPVK